MNIEDTFNIIPYWDNIPEEIRKSIERKFAAHGGHPWVFSGDARMFWQFANRKDINTMYALTEQEHNYLLGWDRDEEWHPETFGYLRLPPEAE